MLDLAQYGGGRCGPDERTRVLIVLAHIDANRSDEGWNAAEGAASDSFTRDLGKEALDQVQPRGAGRGEVEVKPGMLAHPRLHRGMLMRAVVVQDQMDGPLASGLP